MAENNLPTENSIHDDEIDILALLKTIWIGRKTVIIFLIVAAFLGVLAAFSSKNVYTSSTVIVPQVGQSNNRLGSLSSLAAMAGFNLNLNKMDDVLSPMVYPQIVSSVPFQYELMNTPFTIKGVDHPVSIYTYFTEMKKPGVLSLVRKYTLGLPGVIMKALRKPVPDEPIETTTTVPMALTGKQESIRRMIAGAVTLDVNPKEGFLTLTSKMPDARLAAEVTQYASNLLQKYITRIKIEKATDQLNFIQERFNEKKKEFEKAQDNLALFRDRNKNVSTAMARTEEERLMSEYNIAFNVYSELAKQLEQSQIQVKENTPVLSIVAPPYVPRQKSNMGKSKILLIYLFLGGIIGIGIIFGKKYFTSLKQRWNEEDTDQKTQTKAT